MPRTVVVLFGPPGAGKSTATRGAGLEVFDRDDLRWGGNEDSFQAQLRALHFDDFAHVVVIRAGATAKGRLASLITVRATHAWVMTTPADICHRRVKMRGRNPRTEHAAIGTWWRDYDHGRDVPIWPGAWPDLAQPTAVTEMMACLQPVCPRCRGRHRPALPCWKSVTEEISRHVFATQGRACWMCGTSATTVDHITPRAFGGTDDDSNLRPACKRCNYTRGAVANPFAAPPRSSTVTTSASISARWR